jgi:hypothetical protein
MLSHDVRKGRSEYCKSSVRRAILVHLSREIELKAYHFWFEIN